MIVDLVTYTRLPHNTNIGPVLSNIAVEVEELGQRGSLFDQSFGFALRGADETEVRDLLAAHQHPVITAITPCAVSVCLDFYSVPPEDGGPVRDHTAVGELLNAAKYRNDVAAQAQLTVAAVDFISGHPIMRKAELVAAMPGRSQGRAAPGGLPAAIAAAACSEFGWEQADLRRSIVPQYEQKALPEGIDPDANQQNTIVATNVSGRHVLVVDDTMEDGSTLREAVRALRANGAAIVTSLSLAKTLKGTRGYGFGNV